MISCIEAYDVIIVWRAAELVRASLRLLNEREIIAPAIMARSLLELAATALWDINTINKTVSDGLTNVPSKTVITSADLEKTVIKMIHGTRMGDPPQHLSSTNILTPIKKLSKNPNASELEPNYNYLCELAHPNVIGNARFWTCIASKNEDGSETVRMERLSESSTTSEIREKTLWALGWSSACVRNGFEIGQEAIRLILQRWPKVSTN
jgi:hypothetical protein